MPEYPLVSVVVCNYNASRYIIETLDSIKKQTYPNIELVIIDDCSTDNSVLLIEDWLKSYTGRYVFNMHDVNMGGGVTYNEGLSVATGKYYAAIDNDDIILPEKLMTQVRILEESSEKVAAVYSDAYVIDEHSAPIEGLFIQRHRKFEVIPSGNIYAELLQGNFIPVLSLLVRRSVFAELGGYDESLAYGDYDMWLRIARKYDILFSDFVCGKYRVRAGSLTHTIKNWGYSNARIYLKHADSNLPVEELKNIAWQAYLSSDGATMPIVRELATRTKDRVLMAICLLWEFNIALEYGEIFIPSVYRHIAAGLSPNIVNTNDTDANIFLNEVIYSMPTDSFKRLAFEAYKNASDRTMPLIRGLAKRYSDRYLAYTYLFWRFRIPFSIGAGMLAREDEKISSGQATEIDFTSDADATVFLKEIAPNIPDDLFRKIVADAYADDYVDVMPVMVDVAAQSGLRYCHAACLLWKYKIPPAIGLPVLGQVYECMIGGLPEEIDVQHAADSELFLRYLIPAVSPYLFERIAIGIYSNDNADTRQLVNEIAFKTGDRYLITIYLLWKFRISLAIGKHVLNEVKEKVGKGVLRINIDVTDGGDYGLFLKVVVPMITREMLRSIALAGYRENGMDSWLLVQELASGTSDRYLMAITLLWKYRVSPAIAERMLEEVNDHKNNSLPEKISDVTGTDGEVFLREIIPVVGVADVKEFVLEAYRNNNEDTMPLVRDVACQLRDRFIMVINLLWKFGIPFAVGEKVLEEIKGKVSMDAVDVITDTVLTDSQVFLNEVITAISSGLFGRIASDAHQAGNEEMTTLIHDLAYKMGNRYVLAAHLLWKFNFDEAISEEILLKLKERIDGGYPSAIERSSDDDVQLFVKEIVPAIPDEVIERLILGVFSGNSEVLIAIMKALAATSKNRFFKEALLLWKFKINAYTATIILNRIDGYCKAGKSNLYIDICTWKDIVGAIKTKNSGLFHKQ